jgi:SLT domain-containing protein
MCGPIAAEALARLSGNPQQMADILAWAKANNYWDPNVGIENAGFGAIAQHFGIQTSISGSQQAAIAAIAAGHPVVINTPQHYALAQGYDAASGLFDLGYTGETVYGSRYMTLAQLEARGGGFNNFYIADTTSLFGGTTAPAGSSATVSVPSLGINFQINSPVRLEDVAGPIQATGNVLNGTVADWVSQALAATGKPQSWLNDLMLLVAAESGQRNADGSVVLGTGDPRARNPQDVNGQNAQGLMQTLPSTFIANVPPGLPKDISNPVSNAAAAIQYIASRYGNPENTPYWTLHGGSFSTTNVQGYAAGGIIPEPTALLSLRTLQPYAIAGEVGPERVAPLGGPGATARQAVESVVHNWFGVTPETVVKQMQDAQRRERLLRGR